MNWNNINLNSHEISANILDAYNFETLLLEIECNVREINEYTIRKQFQETMESKVRSAYEVFEANFENILIKALEERNNDNQ